jgi:hypothetical protein
MSVTLFICFELGNKYIHKTLGTYEHLKVKSAIGIIRFRIS